MMCALKFVGQNDNIKGKKKYIYIKKTISLGNLLE